MKITTKFNIGDKAWYYIPNCNQYTWGEVINIQVLVEGGNVLIDYDIKNRFAEKGNSYYLSVYRSRDPYKEDRIELRESEVYDSVQELTKELKRKHDEKIDTMTELKKGWL